MKRLLILLLAVYLTSCDDPAKKLAKKLAKERKEKRAQTSHKVEIEKRERQSENENRGKAEAAEMLLVEKDRMDLLESRRRVAKLADTSVSLVKDAARANDLVRVRERLLRSEDTHGSAMLAARELDAATAKEKKAKDDLKSALVDLQTAESQLPEGERGVHARVVAFERNIYYTKMLVDLQGADSADGARSQQNLDMLMGYDLYRITGM